LFEALGLTIEVVIIPFGVHTVHLQEVGFDFYQLNRVAESPSDFVVKGLEFNLER
jgi:5-deoxy-D-glucuronate isomerase